MNDDLKWIKKHYSEKMMHLCRTLFPLILETPGLLSKILSENFYNHKSLAEDIINNEEEYSFRNYIFSKANINREVVNSDKNPYELMREAGYTLYKCKKASDAVEFVKYYKNDELLCTFNELDERFCINEMFFAVKDNAENIKRFDEPKRQDEYGTSVISIQFHKGSYNFISIKNRYNHTVTNPDATFLNDLDNIMPGLTRSFEKYFGYNIMVDIDPKYFDLDGYVKGPDDKFYKVIFELNDVIFCADNIVIKNGKIHKFDKEKYILMEHYLLDLVNKKMINLIDVKIKNHSFEQVFNDIQNIKIERNSEEKIIKILNSNNEENTIIINSSNEFKSLILPHIYIINDNFLYFNKKLQSISLPKVKKISNNFLYSNRKLKTLDLPLVESIGDNFLYSNKAMNNISIPKVKTIQDDFFKRLTSLDYIDLPQLITVGDGFLTFNKKLKKVMLPNLEIIGTDFLTCNEDLTYINLPKVQNIRNSFLNSNTELTSLIMPNVKKIGSSFISYNKKLEYVEMPSLQTVSHEFLLHNENLEQLYLPDLEEVGHNFLYNNRKLNDYDFSKLINTGIYFMFSHPEKRKILLGIRDEINNYR